MEKLDFIQIGSNIGPTDNDIIGKILKEKDWKGIFIEPMPDSFEKLKENYKHLEGCHFENSAIAGHDGDIVIYYRSDEKYNKQQASINKGHWSNNKAMNVPCLTLTSLVTKYGFTGQKFELLQIDAEGADDLILSNCNFNEVLPEKIRFESIHLKGNRLPNILAYLKTFGYNKITDEYIDMVKPTEVGFDTMVKKG